MKVLALRDTSGRLTHKVLLALEKVLLALISTSFLDFLP